MVHLNYVIYWQLLVLVDIFTWYGENELKYIKSSLNQGPYMKLEEQAVLETILQCEDHNTIWK